MELTEQRVQEVLRKAITIVLVVAVSVVAGWWVPRVHYLVAFASMVALGLAFFALTKPEIGVYGLVFFSQIGGLAGKGLPLPLGMNEFNLIFATLLFVKVGEFALTKNWNFRLREKTVGNSLYVYLLVILISTLRAYQAYPHWDFIRSGLGVASRGTLITSQFMKPAMYMAIFFFGYNFAREAGQRRHFVMAMGCSLVVYSATMFLQILNVFPILSVWSAGKERGGILGFSNILGMVLALYLVLFLARKPYFDRGKQFVFTMVVAAICVVALASTLSRTGWVVGMLGWLLLAMTTRRKALMILGIMCLAVVLVSAPLWAPERVKVYFQTSTLEKSSLDSVLSGRVTIWQAVDEYLRQDRKRLIWGGGKFDFTVHGPELGLPWGFYTHSNVLETLVNEGLIGVMVVLWIFARIARILWRDWRRHPSEEVRSLSRLLLILTVLVFPANASWDGREISWYWFLLGMFIAAKEEWARGQSSATTVRASVPQPRLVGAGAVPIGPAGTPSAQ